MPSRFNPGNDVESDGHVRLITRDATITIETIGNIEPDAVISVRSTAQRPNQQPPQYNHQNRFVSLPTAPAPGNMAHLSAVTSAWSQGPSNVVSGAEYYGFTAPQRSPAAAFDDSRNQPPTVSQVRITRDQYAKYFTTDWQNLLELFAEAQRKTKLLNEINKNIGIIYESAQSEQEQANVEEISNRTPRPYSEDQAATLMQQFQTYLQSALISTTPATDLHSLVVPVETTHSLAWVMGDYSFVYSSLMQQLQEKSRNSNVANFNQYSTRIRAQIERFVSNPGPQTNAPYFHLGQSHQQSVENSQGISNGMTNFINTELSQGIRSFVFRYSGVTSPYNQGGLFLFVFQDAAIIISPHLGIMMSQNIDDVIKYIINYTLLLGANKISDKVYISKI
ncbi:hypothetical protein NX722_01425 [Endozoicomonas gorgoniicola]|uniref:Uncharacterized protein n=1 Tax=Endozoicomonas gorgoniicola TaxID=1234144 RepID=A0ABT3MPM2_9GAMM|nr:hypothetical protein [Endozoicomonas gorgoniicola]MCW7551321.1 hypothetical protein [Endozoicomonas gorgoniicola]